MAIKFKYDKKKRGRSSATFEFAVTILIFYLFNIYI